MFYFSLILACVADELNPGVVRLRISDLEGNCNLVENRAGNFELIF